MLFIMVIVVIVVIGLFDRLDKDLNNFVSGDDEFVIVFWFVVRVVIMVSIV